MGNRNWAYDTDWDTEREMYWEQTSRGTGGTRDAGLTPKHPFNVHVNTYYMHYVGFFQNLFSGRGKGYS